MPISSSSSLFLLLFLLWSHIPLLLSHRPTSPHSRRILHQPLFPLPPSPPFQPTPAPSPSQSQSQTPSLSFPKYPSSTNPKPFFPSYPSPPPPPSSSSTPSSQQPTFPANISSLIFPGANNPSSPSSPRSSSKKLIPAILLPIIFLSLIVLAATFLFHRRRQHLADKASARSDVHRLFPPNSATSDGDRKFSASSANNSTEFLYLGTVINSRGAVVEANGGGGGGVGGGGGGGGGGGAAAAAAAAASGSPYRKLGSPELHPLPPLSRQGRHTFVNAEGDCSSDEEFYSPRGSNVGKESPGGLLGRQVSSSHRVLRTPTVGVEEKRGSRNPNLSSPSGPSSNSMSSPTPSSPPASTSPGRSTVNSVSSTRSESTSMGDIEFRPPPPPLTPRPLCPLTPSPPKRRPPSPSPPSSPPENGSEKNTGFPDLSKQNLRPPARIGDFARNPFAIGPTLSVPPPPPPPPPPAGYWESKVQRVETMGTCPPVLLPPKPVMKTSTAAIFPAESPRNSDVIEKSNEKTPLPKLKPLHWDKVRASSDRAMVWDQLKSSSFQLNEEMIETLFLCNTTNTTPKEMTRRQVLPSPTQENRVLDPKKSQNIAILLRALNVTKEEVCEALLEGNSDSLGTELLETLFKMAPTKEEEIKLKEYKDDSPFRLGPAEKFLKAVVDIPFAFKRVEAMLYIANFDSEVNYLRNSFATLEAACEELRSSRMFLKLLEAVLKTGNRMNVGTNRGDAHAFKLDTLLKLVDVKGTDGKTTLLHFVVQEIIRAEGFRLTTSSQSASNGKTQQCSLIDDLELKRLGLPVVSGLSGELSNVKKAAAMDSDVLSSYVSKLAGGIGKISEVVRLNGSLALQDSSQRFHEVMTVFLKKAEDEIIKIQAQESVALSLVKEITEYFHGNSAREEAHPFRIFLVVRDFLNVLDQVCKEVGKINERTIVSSARNFPVPVNPTLPPIFPRFNVQRTVGSSDEDDDSSSSS